MEILRLRLRMTENLIYAVVNRIQFVVIYYSWRPLSPDPGDEHIIDCALNANATVITANVRDFRKAQVEAGLSVMSPYEFVNLLVK